MVTKSKTRKTGKEKKGRVKVSKLQLNKETIKDLSDSASKRVMGGRQRIGERIGGGQYIACPPGVPPEKSAMKHTDPIFASCRCTDSCDCGAHTWEGGC